MTRFPHYTQLDTMDCGPTSLKIVAQFFGRNYALQMFRNVPYHSQRGSLHNF